MFLHRPVPGEACSIAMCVHTENGGRFAGRSANSTCGGALLAAALSCMLACVTEGGMPYTTMAARGLRPLATAGAVGGVVNCALPVARLRGGGQDDIKAARAGIRIFPSLNSLCSRTKLLTIVC